MYVKPQKIAPPGVKPLRPEDRKDQIVKAFVGDSVVVDTTLRIGDRPAAPGNSNVEVVLAENQFGDPIWTGRWWNGVRPDDSRPGLVHILFPRDVTKALRRGSYMFSVRVSDLVGYSYGTQAAGYLLMEYMPTSEQHSIPYRDGTSENFPSGGSGEGGEGDASDEFLIDESGGKWQLGVTNVGALTTTPIRHVPTEAEIAAAARAEAERINNKSLGGDKE